MNASDSGIMIQILLVEDDPGDVLITREAFAENKVRNELSVVSDGEAAMAFLRREEGLRQTRRGLTSSCSTSTCRGRPATRCWPRSSRTPTCSASPSWC